jgi:hypothetical protein
MSTPRRRGCPEANESGESGSGSSPGGGAQRPTAPGLGRSRRQSVASKASSERRKRLARRLELSSPPGAWRVAPQRAGSARAGSAGVGVPSGGVFMANARPWMRAADAPVGSGHPRTLRSGFAVGLSGLAELRRELCVRGGPRLGRLIRCPTGRITAPTGWRPSDTKKLARAAGLARRDSPAPKVRATGALEPRALNARARRTHVPSHARAGEPRSGDFCVRGGPRVRANEQGSVPQVTAAGSWCERIGSDGANRFACRCSTSAGTGCWTAVHAQPGLVGRPKRAGLEPA